MGKDEVWKFLQDDIECETSRLKEEFFDGDEVGHNMEMFNIDGGGMGMMQMDVGMGGMPAPRVPDESCSDKFGWYQCHGHKNAHCCASSCLNNPNKQTGKCQAQPNGCGCNGKCDYRDRIEWTITEAR